MNRINQFSPSKTKTFLRKKFVEAARLHGHLCYITLISDYDDDIHNDPSIKYDTNSDGSLSIRNLSLIFEDELVPNKYRWYNKDNKLHNGVSESVNAYIWLDEVTDTDEYETIRKIIGSVIRWSYYDERNYSLENSKSYKVVEMTSTPSYVLKIKLLPYIEDSSNDIKSKSTSSNYSFVKEMI